MIIRFKSTNELGQRLDGSWYRIINTNAPDLGDIKRPIQIENTLAYRNNGIWYIKHIEEIETDWHSITTQRVSMHYDTIVAREIWYPEEMRDEKLTNIL